MGQFCVKSQAPEGDDVDEEGEPPPATPPGPEGMAAMSRIRKGRYSSYDHFAADAAAAREAMWAQSRLHEGELRSWKDFAAQMIRAHYRECVTSEVVVEFCLSLEGMEETIYHKFNFSHRVTPETLCGLWNSLQTFCNNPYYLCTNDYLVFYKNVDYCKVLCIKSITYIYLLPFY